MKKSGLALTFCCFCAGAISATFSSDELSDRANSLNSNLPIRIDNNLTLNNVTYRQDRILEYNFQLNQINLFSEMAQKLNISIDELKKLLIQEHGSLKNALNKSVNDLAKDIIIHICYENNKELKDLIFDGVKLKYNYYDESGLFISSSDFEKEMCIK